MSENKFLNIVEIQALTLGEAWYNCIREIFEKGYTYTITRGSFAGGKRLEFDFVTIQIRNPGIKPITPDVPQGVPLPVSEEYIEEYLSYLMSDHVEPNEQYTYGMYLAPQFPKVIQMYKSSGFETNQAFMAVGDKDSIDLEDPPCLIGIDTRIRYGKLNFIVYFRSWDLWGGFPANLAGIQRLKEDMASEIGVEDGEIIAVSKGLHLYDHQWEFAKMVLRQ